MLILGIIMESAVSRGKHLIGCHMLLQHNMFKTCTLKSTNHCSGKLMKAQINGEVDVLCSWVGRLNVSKVDP